MDAIDVVLFAFDGSDIVLGEEYRVRERHLRRMIIWYKLGLLHDERPHDHYD